MHWLINVCGKCPKRYANSVRERRMKNSKGAALPEPPLTTLQHIQAQSQIGDGMAEDALGKAAGLVEQEIKNYSRHHAGEKIIVLQA